MKTIKDDLELLGCKVGDYILLEGYGILNGLRGDRINNKKNYYKILGLSQEKDLILKKFGAKKSCILPSYNMNQNYLLFKNNLTKGENKMKTNNDKLRLHLFDNAKVLYSSEKDQYTITYKKETRHYVHYSKWSALFDFFNYLTSKTI